MTANDWAYFAGIVDGEGCIRIATRYSTAHSGDLRRYRPELMVTNTNRRLMDWLEVRVGGKAYKHAQRPEHWKQGWNWVLVGHRVLSVLEDILPHLLLKKMQALVVLSVPRFRESSSVKRAWTPIERAEAAEGVQAITALNRRGVVPLKSHSMGAK